MTPPLVVRVMTYTNPLAAVSSPLVATPSMRVDHTGVHATGVPLQPFSPCASYAARTESVNDPACAVKTWLPTTMGAAQPRSVAQSPSTAVHIGSHTTGAPEQFAVPAAS